MTHAHHAARRTPILLLAAGLSSCTGQGPKSHIDSPPASAHTTDAAPQLVGIGPARAPSTRPGLLNVMTLTPGVYSGSAPQTDDAFDSLAALGVATIISVDGSRPQVESAEARGMRYVHIPIQYSGITRNASTRLAAAVRDLSGPVYVHCHHGKHRGPAAACLALVELGRITPEQGVALLEAAGTSKSYPGLYAAVADASPIAPSALDGIADTLPATAPVPGFVSAMSGLEHTLEHLRTLQNHDWTAPPEHPDLVPSAEAGMLHDYFRAAQADSSEGPHADDFALWMNLGISSSRRLEFALLARNAPAANEAMLLVTRTCTNCHQKYRNE